MPVFSKKIYVREIGNLEFQFNRLFTVDGTRYFITVVDKEHNSHHFKMRPGPNGSWIIEKNEELPVWLFSLEPQLEEAIKKH